ncbi:hypothetical protein TNCV_125971 [Trichonephila clavipes]|nr:hypothetical protein TNCV_125971 [Trichonephila clavipes]
MDIRGRKRRFPFCTRCDLSPVSPQKIYAMSGILPLRCLLLPPAVLRLFADLWVHGCRLVSLDKKEDNPTTTQ